MIKPCDKGAGILMLDFNVYMKACYDHLLEVQTNGNGEEIKYYEQVGDFEMDRSKRIIKQFLQEGFNSKIKTKEEFNAMDPSNMNVAKFYATFKLYKPHLEKSAPPIRPIVSGSGSITENLGVYVDHQIKDIAKRHASYIQDTPDFLRKIYKINQGPRLQDNVILFTMDITGAYTNIPQEDGTACLEEALNERVNQTIPSAFITKMMELILKHNLFEFHSSTWRQLFGTAMGVHPAPDYANIYLARRIDQQIRELAQKYGQNGGSALSLLLRFLDDIFSIFHGTTKQLHEFFEEVNCIHPTLKFTMSHTAVESEAAEDKCNCQVKNSIPFLDISCSIENGKIRTDLYKKETDRNQYLLTDSCHPVGCTKNIPYSLGLKIVGSCTFPEDRDKQLSELKELLQEQEYPERLIDSAIDRARAVPREKALRTVIRKIQKIQQRPVFSVKFDPRLPSISNHQAKHWRSMTSQDQHMKEVFSEPPPDSIQKAKEPKRPFNQS